MDRASTSRGSADDNSQPELRKKLLQVCKFGRPPFLVRNLKYVVEDKKGTRGKIWDLMWTEPSYRSAAGRRQLILEVTPSRCILNRATTKQLLLLPHGLKPYDPAEVHYAMSARLRIWLSIKQEDGNYVAFGIRDTSMNIWPQEYISNGMRIEDCPVKETFDLSAAMAVIGSFPSALNLVVEVFSASASAKPVNAFADKLRGEICILDRELTDTSAIPNGIVKVPLRFTTCESNAIPVATTGRRTHVPISHSLINENAAENEPDLDICIVDDSPSPPRPKPKASETAKPSSDVRSVVALDDSDSSGNESDESGDEVYERPPDGSICLELQGSVKNAISQLATEERPRVYITCKYSSQELPFWDGIVRHDFICPWCHRNCYRFRTLLSHFQLEHEQMKFSLEGTPSATMDDGNGFPFLLNFQVTPVQTPARNDGNSRKKKRTGSGPRLPSPGAVLEDSYANPNRYPAYRNGSSRRKEEDEVQNQLKNVSIQNAAVGSDSDSTEFGDDRDPEFLAAMRDELFSACRYCQRHHKQDYNGKADFCGEWCEVMFKKRLEEGDGPERRDESDSEKSAPLLSYATVPRQKRVNYKESLGHRKLYHVVSVCRATEEHFNEDDPDSEEEVDHSWRLDLSMERVRHLENISPKEKILWMMWNKFAHDNYPVPSVYAERYTRFTLELFALEFGPRIAALKLRLQFVGFLRALHIHGMIDTVAIKSIMLCLDGKKKRRQCGISSRPEIPKEASGRNGRGRGAGRSRNGRKKN